MNKKFPAETSQNCHSQEQQLCDNKILNIMRHHPAASNCIRLGGPVFGDFKDPQEWVKAVKAEGYSAAYCPVAVGTDSATVKAFEKAAKDANIIISEVGAWSNPISRNEKERKDAIKKCKDSLALADLIGAGCCVNITGSRGEQWDGPDPENITR